MGDNFRFYCSQGMQKQRSQHDKNHNDDHHFNFGQCLVSLIAELHFHGINHRLTALFVGTPLVHEPMAEFKPSPVTCCAEPSGHANVAHAMMPVFGPRNGLIGPKIQDTRLNGLAINQQIVITGPLSFADKFRPRDRTEKIADVGIAETG
jgi:hypothetical protein